MNHFRAGCQPLLSLGMFLFFVWPAAAADRVVFSFAPAVDSEISYTTQETHLYDIPGKKSVQQTTVGETLRVEKTDKAGSRVKVTIRENRFEEDGSVKPVPAVDVMSGRDFRLNIGKEGKVLDIGGMTKLAAEIRDSFENPRVREVMAGLWTEEKLRNRFTEEWNSRIAAFSGRSAMVGESWYGTQEIYMPFIGTVTLYRKVTLAGIEKKQGRRVARAVFTWFSDPAALKKTDRGVFLAQLKSLGTVPDLAAQGIGVVGQGEAWVDPGTMTILKETQKIRGAFAGVSTGGGDRSQPASSKVELSREIVGSMKPGKKE